MQWLIIAPFQCHRQEGNPYCLREKGTINIYVVFVVVRKCVCMCEDNVIGIAGSIMSMYTDSVMVHGLPP